MLARALLLALLVVAAGGAAATETGFRAGYELYVGGIRAGELLADVRLADAGYEVRLELEGQGLLGRLAGMRSQAEAAGAVEDGRLIPERYAVDSRRRGDERSTLLVFDRDGQVERLELRPEPEHAPVPEELRRAPDPVSALVMAMRAVRADPTAVHRFTSFGGVRAGAFTITCPRRETLDLARGVDLPGRVLRCELEGEQIAGPRPRFPVGLDLEGTTTLWLAPHHGALVLVRARMPSGFGAMILRIHRLEP